MPHTDQHPTSSPTAQSRTHSPLRRNPIQALGVALTLLLGLALLALPALAQDQGRGKKKGHDKDGNPHAQLRVVEADDSDDTGSHHDDSDHGHRHAADHETADHGLRVADDSNVRMRVDAGDRRGGRYLPRETPIIAMSARVTNLDTGEVQTLDLSEPNKHAQLRVGESARVELLGTAIVNGNGVAVEVPADFKIAAGSWRIDTQDDDANSFIVHARQPNSVNRGNPEGRSGVQFDVRGDYDMKPRLATGRVTFEIADADGDYTAGGGAAQAPAEDWRASARWRQAEAIGRDLAQLDFNPDGLQERDLEKIYEQGMTGIRDVALLQASLAERSGAIRSRDQADVLAHAYRHLLGRQGDTRQIAAADPDGFNNNLRLLQRSGYQALVRTFVDSSEFSRVHDLESYEDLPRADIRRSNGSNDTRYRVRSTRPN